jgi:hypothetical protein
MSLDPLSSTTERQSIAPNLASFRGVFNPASYYFYGDIVQSPLDDGLYIRLGQPVTGLDPSAASPANWVPFSRGSGVFDGTMTSTAAAGGNLITFGGGLAGNVILPGALYQLLYTVELTSAGNVAQQEFKVNAFPTVGGVSSSSMSVVLPRIAGGSFQSVSVSGVISHNNVAAQPLNGSLELELGADAANYEGVVLLRLA